MKFNIDVKVQNDPPRLFSLMHTIISSHDDWHTKLAPRILLGLWHPSFQSHAEKILPYCRRSHIGVSPALAKKHFWDSCEVFSMSFASLATAAGERYAIRSVRNLGCFFFHVSDLVARLKGSGIAV